MSNLEGPLAAEARSRLRSHDSDNATQALFTRLMGVNRHDDKLKEDVLQLLQEGAHPDGPERDGWFLRRAVQLEKPRLIECFLEYGANPNARMIENCTNSKGYEHKAFMNLETVLHYAVYESCRHKWPTSINMILVLIAGGADRHAATRFGLTCSQLAASEPGNNSATLEALATPLHAAIKLNLPHRCLQLLEAGIDPEDKNKRRQSAWRAAELKAPECAAVMHAWKSMTAMAKIAAASRQRKQP